MTAATSPPRPARARAPRPALYRVADRLTVRAPRMPVELYRALTEPVEGKPLNTLPGSLLPADTRIQAAVAVGSPSLFERLRDTKPSASDARELQSKLQRYLVRMSTRPTPFGLFAGVAQARWGDETDVAIVPHESRTRTRPDMEWLALRLGAVESRREVRRHLRLWAHPAAFVHGGRVILSKRQSLGTRVGTSVSIRATSVVVRALDLARQPVAHAELASMLVDSSPGATVEKVEALLDQLHDSGLLLTDLRLAPTAVDPVDRALRPLEGIPEADDVRTELAELARAAKAWDRMPDDERAEAYLRLATSPGATDVAPAEEPPTAPGASKPGETRLKSRVQVDMALGLRGSRVYGEIGVEAARAAELLLGMTPSPQGLRYVAAYRDDFVARYGADREVPLLELLDPDCGIPYALRQLGLGDPKRDPVLLDLATRALFERQRVVTLDDAKLEQLRSYELSPETAPLSLDINVAVAARSREGLDRGEYQVVVSAVAGAQAAGCMLGRFADVLPEGAQDLADAVRAQERLTPGALWAELVDVPRDLHGANVVVRPGVATHEIVVGACPSLPAEQVIPLRELVVGVRGDRFYVRWPKGNTDVVVRAGHMLNPASSGTVAQFLGDVSRDGRAVFAGFQWGPASGFPFLPRVQVGRIVLSLAHWWLRASDARRELRAKEPAAFPVALAAWRERWMVPRHVYVGMVDHRLLLDLEHPDHVEELRREIVRMNAEQSVELHEGLPGIDDAWLPGDDGHYLCELCVSLVQDPAKSRKGVAPVVPPSRVASEAPAHATVVRPPGSEWVFLKVYTPKFLEEELLAGAVRKFARQAVERGLAEEWFFVRYADPELHVRLRFRGSPGKLVSELLPAAFAWLGALVDERVCSRFVVDTYDREVERYGGPEGMRLAESVFAADSVAVAELLALLGRASADDRTCLALRTVTELLGALGLGERGRLAWLKGLGLAKCRADFAGEYRRLRDRLVALLHAPPEHAARAFGKDAVEVLARRREALEPLGRELAAVAKAGLLSQPPATLFRSHVHMHLNRLLGPDPEAERRVYGLLVRTHESLHHAPGAA